MKLRLPSKLQAALIATLASVSFTTLSTGTLTVAAGAAFLAGQQAWAQVTSIHPMQQVVVAGETYTSTAENGVLVTEGNNGDGAAINLSPYTTAEYLVLTSTSNGRYKVNDASNLANFGTVVLAAGSYKGGDGNDVNFSGGQIFVNGGASVSNNLILGTSGYSETNNWAGAIRMGGNNTFSGKVDIVQDTTLVMGGSATFTGNVRGEGKTLRLNKTGTLTFSGGLTLGTLNITEAGTVVVSGSADNKSSIGNVTSVANSTVKITNTNLGISGSQTFQSNLEIGAGSTVTVKQTDSLKYSDITNTITLLENGVLDLGGFRWTVGSGTTFVMDGGTIQGAGDQHGALDFHQNNATIRATADSTISAKLRLRATTTNFDVTAGTTLTLSGVVRDNGHLHKLGAGTLVLSGSAEYTGSTILDAGTIKVAGTGTLAEGVFTSAAGTRFINEGTATIGKDGTNSSLVSTVANTGALTLKGTIAVQTTDLTVYKVAHQGEETYSGSGAYAGSGYLNASTTEYFLVETTGSGTLANSATYTGVATTKEEGNNLLFTVTPTPGSGTYYINSDLAYNGTEMGGATTIAVAAGKTLSVSGEDLTAALSKTYGAGNVTVTSNGTINGGGSSAPYTTHAIGTLTVASGKTLTLGNSKDNAYLDFSSFTGVVLENDAQITLNQRPGMTFQNLSVAAGANAKFIGSDTYNELQNAGHLTGATTINGSLIMSSGWKYQFTIDKLVGGGTLELQGSNEKHHVLIGGTEGAFGTVKWNAGGTSTEVKFTGNSTVTNLQNANNNGSADLTVNSGVTLDLLGNATNVNVVNNSGTISLHDGSTFTVYAKNSGQAEAMGNISVAGSATIVDTNFHATMNFTTITGGAGATLTLLSSHSAQTSEWNLGVSGQTQASPFTGKLVLMAEKDGSSDRAANFNFVDGTMFSGAEVQIKNGTEAGNTLTNTLKLKAASVTIGGLSDAAAGMVTDMRKWSVANASGQASATLTLNGTGTYVSGVKLGSGVNLVMNGTGSQTFSGDASAFDGTITVNSGTLAFGGNVSATGLAGAGGTLDVTGTLTLTNAAANEFNGTLAVGGLTKAGEGALTLHGISRLGSTIDLQGGSLVFGAGEYDLTATPATHSSVYSEGDHGYATTTDVVQLVSTGANVSTSGATFKYTGGGETVTADAVAADGTVSFAHEQDMTTYYLVDGTSVDLATEWLVEPYLLSKVSVLDGTGTIHFTESVVPAFGRQMSLDVAAGATAALTGTAGSGFEFGLSEASSFGEGATVDVAAGIKLSLYHAGSAATVIQHATGNGEINLGVDATLGNGTTTAATGKLTIADGKTLTLGGGENDNVNISSFSQVVLNGGNIIVDSAASTIQGLTVDTGKTGVFLVNDLNAETYLLAGVTRADGNLTVANYWNAQVQVAALVGAGTFSVSGYNGDTADLQRDAQQKLVLTINSLSSGSGSFTGDLVISHNTTAASDNLDTFTINTGDQAVTFRSMTVDFNQEHATGPLALNLGADATMTGAMTLTSGNVAVAGAHTLTVGGLTDSGLLNVAGNLTINVAEGGAYTYGGLQSLGGKLTKSGAGAQTLTVGTQASPFLLHEAMVLTDGTLTLGGHILLQDGAFEPTGEGAVKYIDLNGNEHDRGEGSGYEAASGNVTVVDVTGGTLNVDDATFTYKGKVVNVGTNGTFEQAGNPAYNAYYIYTDTVSFAGVYEKSAAEKDFLTDVYLYGGELDFDSDDMLMTLHLDTGSGTADITGATASIITLEGKGTLNVDSATNLNGAYLNIAEGDTLTLTGGATVTYNNISNRGTLDIGENTTVTTSTTALAVGEGETFVTTGDGTLATGGLTVNGGTVTLDSEARLQNVTLSSGSIALNSAASASAINVSGGTLDINAATAASSISVSGGTLNINAATTITTAGTGDVGMDLGKGTININADTTLNGRVQIGSGDGQRFADITIAEEATLTASEIVIPWGFGSQSDHGVLTVNGDIVTSNFQISTGEHAYEVTGTGVINTDKLDVSNQTTNAIFSGGLTLNIGGQGITGGRPLELRDVTVAVRDGSNGWTANRAIKLGDADTGTTFSPGAGETITLGGVLSGSGKLAVNGGGTLVLSGANTFSGNILVSEGTIVMGNNNALGASNASGDRTITIATGGVIDVNAKDNTIYKYTLAGGSLVNNGSDDTSLEHIQNAGITLTADSSVGGSHKMYMVASGWGETTANLNDHVLTKLGEGTFSFVNTAVSSGTIKVNEGTVEFNSNKTLSRVQADIVLNGGTITGAYKYADSQDAVTRTLTALKTAEASAAIELGSNVTLATSVEDGQTLTLTGAITGPGAISKDGAGALVLGGSDTTNVINQAITLTDGTLSFGGTVDLTALEPTGEPVREFVGGMTDGSGNGFASDSAAYQLVTVNGGQIDLAASAGAKFMHGEMEGELNANGEVVLDGVTSYLAYYVNNAVEEDADVDTLSHAIDTAAGQDPAVTLATLQMAAAGTRLAVDRTDSVANLAITAGEGSASLVNPGEGSNSLTVTNLALGGKLNVGTGVTLNLATALGGTTPDLANLANNGGTVSIALANSDNVLTMDAASTGTLELRSGAISYRSVLGSQTLRMGNGTKLLFGSNAGQVDNPVFTTDIEMAGDMEIAVYGTNYHTLTTMEGTITGTGKLTKSDGGNMVFSNSVNVGSLTVTGGTVDFNGNTQLASTGTLTVNGGSTANFNSTEDMTFQAFSVAGNNTHVSFDGAVTVTGTGSGNDYVNVTGASGLTVDFNQGFAFSGKGGQFGYALLIGNGSTVTLGGTTDLGNYLIGPAAGSTLVVAENAALTVKGIYNSTGTATANGTLTVNSNATVNVTGALYEVTVNTAGNITVGGATSATTAMNVTGGTNTFNGAATVATLNANAGTATFNGTTTITNLAANGTGAVVAGSGAITVTNATQDQGVRIAKGKDLTLVTANLTATTLFNLGTLTIGDGSTPTLVKTTYFVNGNMQDTTVPTGFEIKSGATVAISGGDNEDNTHQTGLVLSEWQNTTSATVAGNLLAKNATLLGGNDYGFTLNINDGGVVAVKGIKSRNNKTHSVNLNDGGKLVLGGTTSANGGGTLNAAAGGTIGISADTASYNGAIATTAQTGKAVKIDTAKYAFNDDGTAIEQGTDGGTLNLSGAVSGDATIEKTGAGTANFTGNVSAFTGSVDVEAGTLNIMNIAQATSLNVKDVTIGAGATMGVYNGTTATAETDYEGTLTMKNGNTLKAGGENATLNANLVMESGSTLEVSLAQATHGLTMGCSVALNTGDLLGEDDLGFVQNLQFGDYYYLYNGVNTFTVNGTQYERLNFTDWTNFDMDASNVYTQLDEKRYALVYSWNGENVGTIAITLIPEPTTSTLSLLALCALAARRRRKD